MISEDLDGGSYEGDFVNGAPKKELYSASFETDDSTDFSESFLDDSFYFVL